MYFVNQKKHNSSSGSWDNNVHTKDTENAAKHQFHAFMSTYAYEQDQNIDYASASVETMDGRIILNEVDNRIQEAEEG